MNNIKTALIFSAGLGTRLRPLTDTKPKALVCLGDKPLLQIAIERLIKADFRRIVINTHHFAEQIFDFVAKNKFDAQIDISHEKDLLLDTGGGIKFAHNMLGNEPFLAYNVDIVSNVDLSKLYKAHNSHTLATLLVSHRETSRYLLFDDDNKMVGWHNSMSDQTKTYLENIDITMYRHLAFNGLHVISPRVFALMEDWNEPFSITDFYISVCEKESIIAYQQPDLKVVDVGTVEKLNIAQKYFL